MSFNYNKEKEKIEEVVTFKEMIGLTFEEVTNINDHTLKFSNTNCMVIFDHTEDCCEVVEITDICGELSDLVGSPILKAESVSRDTYDTERSMDGYEIESGTWTFYKFATQKGSVTVRWLGSSNGYYSEEVNYNFIKKEKNEFK